MPTIVTQELAQRVAISPATYPVGTIPPPGTTLVKDSNTTQLTYTSAPAAGSAIQYSSTNLPAAPGVGLIWFDPVAGYLKFRKRAEDGDANVYSIALSDAIPA